MKMLVTQPEGYPLVFGQDAVHAISKGKTLTPKNVGFGMSIHQTTRSRSLVSLVRNAGHSINYIPSVTFHQLHSISYSQVQRVDTTLAKRILDKFMGNGNFPVPPNLLEGKVLQFAADNIDIIQETLDGKATFHATQMVAFQRGEPTGRSEQQLPLGKGGLLKIPEELKKTVESCSRSHCSSNTYICC